MGRWKCARSWSSTSRRHDRVGLSRGVPPRPRHPDPPARRFRSRRGGASGCVRRGGRTVADRGHTRQPARVADLDRPVQSHRPAASTPSRSPGRNRASGRNAEDPHDVVDDRLRLTSPAAIEHQSGRAGGNDVARGMRSDDRAGRRRVSHGRPDAGAAHRAPRRRSATRGFRTKYQRGPTCPSGSPPCST